VPLNGRRRKGSRSTKDPPVARLDGFRRAGRMSGSAENSGSLLDLDVLISEKYR
jgi:hypothetical protein